MDFKAYCDEITLEVRTAIAQYIGNQKGAVVVKIGADGTPTKLIDQVAEECIRKRLVEDELCEILVSEECGNVCCSGKKGTIYLDPVDGTYNAIAGIPFYAISIAYAENGRITRGYIQNLANGETFYSELGKGAFLNDSRVNVSNTKNLDKCAMSIYGKKFDPGRAMQLGQKIRRWRLLGASALEISYIGAGRIDAFVDLRGTLRVTDAAAAILFCEEAGGYATDLNGNKAVFPDDVRVGRCLIATNMILHHKIIEYLR